MAAPTLSHAYNATNTTGSTISTPTMSWAVNDVVVVLYGNEGAAADTERTPTNTGSGLSLTVQQVNNQSNNCGGQAVTAVATAASTGTVTCGSSGSSEHNFIAGYVFSGSAGVGNTAKAVGSARTVSLTPTGADSAISWAVFDWAAANTTTLTPTPTSHSTSAPGPQATPISAKVSASYTYYCGELDDQTSAGAVSYGITGTGTGPFTIFAVEAKAGGTTTHSGSATGSVSATGSATGTTVHSGSATGSVSATGSATGTTVHSGSATGSVSATGTATGNNHYGSATGSVSATGSATGVMHPSGSATGSVSITGSATGVEHPSGSATGSVSATGSATGTTVHSGSAAGSVSATGTATGVEHPSGSATGSVSITGFATGGSSTPNGAATGSVSVSGTATGTSTHSGSATGAVGVTGAATGTSLHSGSATGSVGVSGSATGVIVVSGSATGVCSITGVAAGAVSNIAYTVTFLETGRVKGVWKDTSRTMALGDTSRQRTFKETL